MIFLHPRTAFEVSHQMPNPPSQPMSLGYARSLQLLLRCIQDRYSALSVRRSWLGFLVQRHILPIKSIYVGVHCSECHCPLDFGSRVVVCRYPLPPSAFYLQAPATLNQWRWTFRDHFSFHTHIQSCCARAWLLGIYDYPPVVVVWVSVGRDYGHTSAHEHPPPRFVLRHCLFPDQHLVFSHDEFHPIPRAIPPDDA